MPESREAVAGRGVHPLDRSQLKEVIEEALREQKGLIKEALREEFEMIGLDANASESRAEIRKDMEKLRLLREKWPEFEKNMDVATTLRSVWNRAAAAIGNTILYALAAALLAVIGWFIKLKAT